MIIKKLAFNHYIISDIKNNQLIIKKYLYYTLIEAKQLFNKHLINKKYV